MALKAAARKKLPKSAFGMPGSRKYPMHDRKHAANAKARATQQMKKGRISKATKDRIHAQANKKLYAGKRKKR